MAPSQQDQFIDEDEEEECCPLCVETLDLFDLGFVPCPCGYQICQFCYNNIKTTMNGLCPACRRPYDDKPFRFKQVSQEEILQHSQNKAAQQKKRAAAKQKEVQKREADNLSRKHLAGLRVRQKNLVYVTGMKPKIQGERVSELLRGPEYFGQYGEIIKVVVSKGPKDVAPSANQPVGIYVTFTRKEDAAACIEAINQAAQSGDGKMRAQHGTTKYCSAYLRGDICNNRNCMFLHEPGEQNESFSRQDLSSLNAASTQQPAPEDGSQPPPQTQAPPQHTQPIAAATQENVPTSPTDSSGDNSGLPAGANWANQTRRESRSTIDSNLSPVVTNSGPSRERADSRATQSGKDSNSEVGSARTTSRVSKVRTESDMVFNNLLKAAFNPDIKFCFAPNGLSEEDQQIIKCMPPLWDPQGGAKRRLMKEREAEERRQQEEDARTAPQEQPNLETEDHTEGVAGSLQLGGEPEERPDRGFGGQQHHAAIQPPSQAFGGLNLGQGFSLGDDHSTTSGSTGRGVTPLQSQQQQQMLLQQLRNTSTTHQQTVTHGRGNSRFSFVEGATSSVSTVKPASLLKQQQSMHYSNLGQQQALGSQFYSGVQGPPPGLKTSGTPPVSGGGMFGQGHGFTTSGVGYGPNAPGREDNKMWDLQRGYRGNPDAGKRELFSSFPQHLQTSTPAPASGPLGYQYGASGALGFQDVGGAQKQKKKGKKHRHANTSSSGGGGVVDGADPSILQARLHPHGASGITGQGLYGSGQGQAELPSLGQIIDPPRRATPTLPPGLFPPNASTVIEQGGSSKSVPVTNELPEKEQKVQQSTEIREAKTDTDQPDARANFPGKPAFVSKAPVAAPAKEEEKLTVKKGAAKEEKNLAPAPKVATPKIPLAKSAETKDEATTKPAVEQPPIVTPVKAEPSTGKRAHPGKLQISTAPLTEKDLQSAPASVATPKRDVLTRTSRAGSIATPSVTSRPGTPGVTGISTGSPMRRTTQPRTIRITDTPRTETPPLIAASPAAATPLITPAAIATASKQTSRRPSVVSTNQPGTPVSEQIDLLSITSASVSRASSPPPITTNRKALKKEAKKQRQKEKDAEIAAAVVAPKETSEEQAPIMARKTKSKKSKPVLFAATVTPKVKTSATSPTKEAVKKIEPAVEKEVISEKPKEIKLSGKGKAKAAAPPPASPKQAALPASPPKDNGKSPQAMATAATILQALESTHQLALSTLSLLKPLTSQSELRRLGLDPFTSADLQNHIEQLRLELSKADEQLLKQGKAVRKDLGDDGRISGRNLVTPERTRLACLTREEEDRYLEIEKRVKETKGLARWGGSSSKKLSRTNEMMKTLTVATETFESALRDAQLHPTNQSATKNFDAYTTTEASDYVNQFVPPYADLPGGDMVQPKGIEEPRDQLSASAELVPGSTFTANSLQEAMATAQDIAKGKGAFVGNSLVGAAGTGSGAGVSVEKLLAEAKKESEGFEKKMNALIRKNRKLAFGAGH